MKIKVQYFAMIREIANLREEVVDLPQNSTLLDLLKLLAEKHGERFNEYVFDSKTGSPRKYLQYLLNENPIPSSEGLATVLQDNSSLAIIPPVGGG